MGTSNDEAFKRRRREIAKRYRERHPDRVREQQRQYRLKNPEASTRWQREHREEFLAVQRRYAREHYAAVKERHDAYRATMFLEEGDPRKCVAPGCPRRKMDNGLCPRHRAQERAGQQVRRRRLPGYRPSQPWRITEDDGILDEVAISLAVSGERRVRLTDAERVECVRIMAGRNVSPADMAVRVVTSPHKIRVILAGLGLEIVRQSGFGNGVVLPVDRLRREPTDLDLTSTFAPPKGSFRTRQQQAS